MDTFIKKETTVTVAAGVAKALFYNDNLEEIFISKNNKTISLMRDGSMYIVTMFENELDVYQRQYPHTTLMNHTTLWFNNDSYDGNITLSITGAELSITGAYKKFLDVISSYAENNGNIQNKYLDNDSIFLMKDKDEIVPLVMYLMDYWFNT